MVAPVSAGWKFSKVNPVPHCMFYSYLLFTQLAQFPPSPACSALTFEEAVYARTQRLWSQITKGVARSVKVVGCRPRHEGEYLWGYLQLQFIVCPINVIHDDHA